MFDEGLLSRALTEPAHDAPARALDEIMHLAQSAKYDAAAERAAALLEGGCKDVRAFVVYALGVFAERGPGSIPALFDPITVLLSTRAPRSNLSSAAARTTDTALRLCFRIIKAHLDFEERKTTEAREAWSRYFQESSAASVLRACADLRTAINEVIETPRCDAELGNVMARLEAYCGRFTPETRPERGTSTGAEFDREPVESSVHAAESLEEPCAGGQSERPVESMPLTSTASVHSEVAALTVSPALQQFMRKLEVFEQLVECGSLAKAAIVAQDIRQVVANFDPMVYLPKLLAPHFRLLSSNVEQLSPYWEQCATPGWQALEQLYRVDLDAFIEA